MSDQTNAKLPQEATHEPPYYSDSDWAYCEQLREMQEQVSRREADYRNSGSSDWTLSGSQPDGAHHR